MLNFLKKKETGLRQEYDIRYTEFACYIDKYDIAIPYWIENYMVTYGGLSKNYYSYHFIIDGEKFIKKDIKKYDKAIKEVEKLIYKIYRRNQKECSLI